MRINMERRAGTGTISLHQIDSDLVVEVIIEDIGPS
jgi:hypothetical protein